MTHLDKAVELTLRTIEECGGFVVSITGEGVDLCCQGETREQALERIAMQGAMELKLSVALPKDNEDMREALIEAVPLIGVHHAPSAGLNALFAKINAALAKDGEV